MKKRMAAFILIFAMMLSISACSNGAGTVIDPVNTDENPANEPKKIEFEQSLIDLDKDLDRWGSRFFWSPDGSYALAEGSSSKPEVEKAAVILVDVKNNKMIKLKDGYIVSAPAWSKDSKQVAFATNKEMIILNTKDQSYEKISDQGYLPQFSPDNSKLVYMNEGLWIYNIADKSNTQITKSKYDASPVWFSDSQRIFYFRDNGKNLGDGAGNQQVMSILNISAENKYEDLDEDMNLKGKFRLAKWLVADEKLFIYAGWDDGHAYHILDMKNNKLIKDIAYEENYITFDEVQQKLLKMQDYQASNLLEIYDYEMKKVADIYINNDQEYTSAQNNFGITALKVNRIAYLHCSLEENKGVIMISNLADGRQTRITEYGDYSIPFVSPDSSLLAYMEAGHKLIIKEVDSLKEIDVKTVENEKNALSALLQMLPDKVGAEWIYNGFAEYGHTMRVDAINQLPEGQVQYMISGKVDDMSDGESKKDFRVSLEYVVSKNGLREIVKKGEVMPHKIMEFDVLRYPLTKGNAWTQTVSIAGNSVELNAEIIEETLNSESNTKIIKVQYTANLSGMPNDEYKEIRTYEEGKGLVAFENTFDNSIYFIYTLYKFSK